MSGQPGYRLTARAALTAKGVIARGIGMVAAIGVLTTWGLTQHAALRLGFHAALGRPWLPAMPDRDEILNLVAWGFGAPPCCCWSRDGPAC